MGGKRWDGNHRTNQMTDRKVLLTVVKSILSRLGQQPTVGNLVQVLSNRSKTSIAAELNRCAAARVGMMWEHDTFGAMIARRQDLDEMGFELQPPGVNVDPAGVCYVTGTPMNAILDYGFQIKPTTPWDCDWRASRDEVKQAIANKELKVEELTHLLNLWTHKEYKDSTVTRYLNGGKQFVNGPPELFKEFLVAVYRVRHCLWTL